MKWGKRKAKYVTVHQGIKNAKAARKKAYYDSAEASGAKKYGPIVKHPNRKSKYAARAAGKTAYKESIKNDKVHNIKLRAAKRISKLMNKKINDFSAEERSRFREKFLDSIDPRRRMPKQKADV
jgi:hypothetical protein